MNAKAAISAYQTAIRTTPPLQAIVLLYDGILVRVHNAELAAERGDYETQFKQIQGAIAILRGLIAALDMVRGGDFATRLRDTYETNMRALLRSVGKPTGAECCRRIGGGLRNLRNAWATLAGVPLTGGAANDDACARD